MSEEDEGDYVVRYPDAPNTRYVVIDHAGFQYDTTYPEHATRMRKVEAFLLAKQLGWPWDLERVKWS